MSCSKVNTRAVRLKLFLSVMLIAQAGSATAQMKADIVGLRLGMDINETVAAIKANAPTAQVTVLKDRMPKPIDTEFDALVVAATGTDNWQQREAEMIMVSFSGPPGAPRAIDIHRVQHFGEGAQPLMGAVISAIKRKYGEPNEERSGLATNRMMTWRASANGQPVPSQVMSGGLCTLPTDTSSKRALMTMKSLLEDHRRSGAGAIRPGPTSGALDPRCGFSLAAFVRSTQDRAKPDTYFVDSIAVRLTDLVTLAKDHKEVTSLLNGTHEIHKRAAAEAEQKAATRPAPKF